MSGGMRSAADEMAMAETCLRDVRIVAAAVPRIAARETYVAALHAAHARIAATGRAVPATHKGVNVLIGELYRGSGFPAQAILSGLEDWKASADYGRGAIASEMDADMAIGRAAEFIERLSSDIDPDLLHPGVDAESLAALRRMYDLEP